MTTLTYRGKNYVQNKEVVKKQLVELTYRRNVYTNRMDDASSSNEKAELNYNFNNISELYLDDYKSNKAVVYDVKGILGGKADNKL